MNNPYSNNTTTTRSSFTVEDITHKPTRMQSDIISEIQREQGEEIEVAGPSLSSIPSTLTLESMISYYEKNQIGEVAKLYKATAMWLTTCLKAPRVKAVDVPYENKDNPVDDMEENRVVTNAGM